MNPVSTLAAQGRRPAGALLSLLLPWLLTGCSGSRFGDALSRSFSSPGAPAVAPDPAREGSGSGAASPAGSSALGASPGAAGGSRAAPATTGEQRRAAPAPAPPTASGRQPGTVAPTAASGQRPIPAPAQPRRSAPYRVTILLPQADAAAPAEVVTQALRTAGVPFEVETIERLAAGAAPAGQDGPATPSRRPAPEPR